MVKKEKVDVEVKVSIIIPAYKDIEFLRKPVESLLEQTFENWELIITDDKSTKAKQDFINSLANPKIKYVVNNPALGQAENCNACLKLAQGELIKMMHDDDWFSSKESLKKFVELMDNNPNCDFGYSNNIHYDVFTGKITYKRHAERYVKKLRADFIRLITDNNIGQPSNTIFRNKYMIKFDSNLKNAVDTDFYISFLKHKPNLAFTKEYLISSGDSDESETNLLNENVHMFEMAYFYDKYSNLINLSACKNRIEKSIKKLLKKYEITSNEELQRFTNSNVTLPTRLYMKNSFLRFLEGLGYGK